MTRARAILCAAALACANEAAAECLDARDLGRGVEVQFLAGEVYTMRRDQRGQIVVIEDYRDGSNPLRFRSDHGIFVHEEVEIDQATGRAIDASRILIDYGAAASTLPEPAPGATWRGNTTNIFADGAARDEVFSATFRPLDRIAVDDCTYDVIYADLRYDWPDMQDGMSLTYAYLPQIGGAFLISSAFDGEDAGPPNVPVAIRRAQK